MRKRLTRRGSLRADRSLRRWEWRGKARQVRKSEPFLDGADAAHGILEAIVAELLVLDGLEAFSQFVQPPAARGAAHRARASDPPPP